MRAVCDGMLIYGSKVRKWRVKSLKPARMKRGKTIHTGHVKYLMAFSARAIDRVVLIFSDPAKWACRPTLS